MAFADFVQTHAPPDGQAKRGRKANGTNAHGNAHKNGAIIDFMIAQPRAKQRDIAEHFGFSMQHLSRLVSSDAFQGELKERRASIAKRVEDNTLERLQGLAHTAIARMVHDVEHEPSLPHAEARESCEMALKALGYAGTPAARPGQQAQAPVQINILSTEDLANARAKIGQSTRPELLQGEAE